MTDGTPRADARRIAKIFGILVGALVLLPLPVPDLLLIVPLQVLLLFLVGLAMRMAPSLSLMGSLVVSPLVVAYAGLGVLVSYAVAGALPVLGLVFLAPLAGAWTYALGEITLASGEVGTVGRWAMDGAAGQ